MKNKIIAFDINKPLERPDPDKIIEDADQLRLIGIPIARVLIAKAIERGNIKEILSKYTDLVKPKGASKIVDGTTYFFKIFDAPPKSLGAKAGSGLGISFVFKIEELARNNPREKIRDGDSVIYDEKNQSCSLLAADQEEGREAYKTIDNTSFKLHGSNNVTISGKERGSFASSWGTRMNTIFFSNIKVGAIRSVQFELDQGWKDDPGFVAEKLMISKGEVFLKSQPWRNIEGVGKLLRIPNFKEIMKSIKFGEINAKINQEGEIEEATLDYEIEYESGETEQGIFRWHPEIEAPNFEIE